MRRPEHTRWSEYPGGVRRRPPLLRWLAGTASVVVTLLLTAVIGVAPAGASGQKVKSLHYEGVTLNMPRSWRVTRSAPAGVTVVNPKVVAGTCRDVPAYSEGPCGIPRPADAFTIVSLHTHTRFSPPGLEFHVTKVNGLRVLVATTSYGTLVWHVPSLGIEVSGSGAQVAGVFRTLRRA